MVIAIVALISAGPAWMIGPTAVASSKTFDPDRSVHYRRHPLA